jgi:DNA-binding transcriptional regulator YdaS (Cro superfamily)
MLDDGMDKALETAILALGTAQKFAEKVGVTPQAVSQWRQVPPLRVLKVEAVSGVSRHLLRPDLYPPPRHEEAEGDEP